MSLLLSFTKNWDNIRKNTQKLRSKLLVSDRFLPKSLLTWVLLSYWQVLTLSVFRIEFWESSPPTVQFTLDLSPTGTCRMATSYASWFSWVHSLWTQKMWQSSFKQQLNDSMIASLSLILSLIQKMKIVTCQTLGSESNLTWRSSTRVWGSREKRLIPEWCRRCLWSRCTPVECLSFTSMGSSSTL